MNMEKLFLFSYDVKDETKFPKGYRDQIITFLLTNGAISFEAKVASTFYFTSAQNYDFDYWFKELTNKETGVSKDIYFTIAEVAKKETRNLKNSSYNQKFAEEFDKDVERVKNK